MTTKETLQEYFRCLAARSGWQRFLADDMKFTSFSTPFKLLQGSATYVESTARFYSLIAAIEVKQFIVDEHDAVALTRYTVKIPGGPSFDTHVAEVFKVDGDQIVSLDIYFDSAPFPKPPTVATS